MTKQEIEVRIAEINSELDTLEEGSWLAEGLIEELDLLFADLLSA